MVKRASEMHDKINVAMRGGEGSVLIHEILDKGEYQGHARLMAVITLKPGCSIGEHLHENEEEIFYVLEGEAVYNDNGKTEIMHQGDSCVCLSGQKHSLSNGSETENLSVFAVILTY